MAESLLRQSERKRRPPAYLEDYVWDPTRPLSPHTSKNPLFPESLEDDVRSVTSCASKMSVRSEFRRKQRDAERAAQLQLLEIEDKAAEEAVKRAEESAKREEERKKKIVRLKLANQLEDIADEEQELCGEDQVFTSGFPPPHVKFSETKVPVVSGEEKSRKWLETETPEAFLSNPFSTSNPFVSTSVVGSATPPESVVSVAQSENVQIGEMIAGALRDGFKQLKSNDSEKTLQSGNFATNRLLARKTFGGDLPHFYGKPEQWLDFQAAYHEGSEECQFTNSENLRRLRKCLKGEALAHVAWLIRDPDNVPKILRALELRFGQKYHIIGHVLAKMQFVPVVKDNDLTTLIAFGEHLRDLVSVLQGFKSDEYLSNPQMLKEMEKKLSVTLRLEWRKIQKKNPTHSLVVFEEWMSEHVELAYTIEPPKFKDEKVGFKNVKKNEVKDIKPGKRRLILATEENEVEQNAKPKKVWKCLLCQKEGHSLPRCPVFKKFTPEERHCYVVENRLCFSCLFPGHSSRDCKYKKKCSVEGCEFEHHTLLHGARPREPREVVDPILNVVQQQLHISSQITYQVVPVILRGPKAEVTTYALLDPGSAYTLLDEELASSLQLSGKSLPLGFSTIKDEGNTAPSRCVELKIVNPTTKEEFPMSEVRTFSSLSLRGGTVTSAQLKMWKHLDGLPLPLYCDVRPKILIGLPHHKLITPLEVVEGPHDSPAAGKTRLGWMVYGKLALPRECERVCYVNGVYNVGQPDNLHQLVKSFFSTEEFGVKVTESSPITSEEQKAEEIALSSLRQVGNRYEIGLLWKDDGVVLPESKTMAMQRLLSVERKLDRDPVYAKKYCENIQHYVDSGYLLKLSEEEARQVTPKTWYLPHFGVTKASKPEKLRLVFDAAATSHGVSLNSQLYSGPDILRPLPSVLCKFRERKVAISADIKEMFHQVLMRQEDQQAQRILWRGMNRDRPPDVYKMQVMTFGATCSPYCAQLVKRENALEFRDQYPRAVEAIVNRHYVDDLLDSCDSVDEAVHHFIQVFKIQQFGGFHLCNWTSNDADFMAEIPEELRSKSHKLFRESDSVVSERILGLEWDPKEDCFGFTTNFFKVRKAVLSGEEPPLKREALSVVMSVFDPLGFAAVLTIKAKILLQRVWRTGIGWDDVLPDSLWDSWKCWIAELQTINGFKIPRCYSSFFSTSEEVDLHVFCDASELAYAAVAYARLGNGDTAFIAAKTRVTPLKPMTIPRYELQAAVLGVRLAQSITDWHDVSFTKRYYWTDSRIVKCWLSMDRCRLKTFVSNRVGEVLEVSDVTEWSWISTHDNVADEATRDKDPCDFSPTSRWLNGPAFLRQAKSEWPCAEPMETEFDLEILEVKKEFCGHLGMVQVIQGETLIDVYRFSNWLRLIRATAYVQKAAKSRFKKCDELLTVSDLDAAEETWWKWSQAESFPEIVLAFRQQNTEKIAKALKQSPLKNLSVFMDEQGVLRMKGRVQAEDVEIGNLERNPVILEPKHPYTVLLVHHYHKLAGHHGKDRVTNNLKQGFCILALKETVKRAWRDCQKCKNSKVVPIPPEMAPLPKARLESYQRPFTQTGVDYFGPVLVAIGRRHEKRYGALFTCLVTRAVHLELAGSLSTGSFIMALRRFISRRGNPKDMHSDNGTNFVGANHELRKALLELDQEVIRDELKKIILELDQKKIQNDMTCKSINWHFNPPQAPHMGGSWERMVRSVKTALYATLKDKVPREETLQTFLVEAENTVNGHPLVYVDADVESDVVLTPNHFLIGTPNSDQPPGVFTDRDLSLRKQWRLAMRLTDLFWKRWIREFLPTLTRRQKWIKQAEPLKVGDIVIVVDDAFPRSCWPKGVITEVPVSPDGQTRWAIVKTYGGTYKRPTSKLCVLDVRRD